MQKEKVFIPRIAPGSVFLKTPSEVFAFFGFSTSPRNNIKSIVDSLELEINVSDRSLDNLGGKGISEKKAKEIFSPIFLALKERFGCDIESLIPDRIRDFDIHVQWSAVTKVFDCDSQQAKQYRKSLQPLKAFIERRCREYQPQRMFFEQHSGKGREECIRYMADCFRPVLGQTLLDEEQQVTLINLFDKLSSEAQVRLDSDELKTLALFNFDFFLSLFASLDLTVRSVITQSRDTPIEQEGSLISPILDTEGKCYFEKLINFMKKKADCSYRELAQFIPIEYQSTDSGRTEEQAKTERLKEWRKGKTKPSFKVVCEFFLGLPTPDRCPLLILGVICLAIDRIVGQFEQEDERALLQDIFSAENYARYYEKEKLATQQ